jgi:hypothetical protein
MLAQIETRWYHPIFGLMALDDVLKKNNQFVLRLFFRKSLYFVSYHYYFQGPNAHQLQGPVMLFGQRAICVLCIVMASLLASHLYWHGSTPPPWLTVWCARTFLVLSIFMRTLPHVKAKLCGSAAGTQQKHSKKVEDIAHLW